MMTTVTTVCRSELGPSSRGPLGPRAGRRLEVALLEPVAGVVARAIERLAPGPEEELAQLAGELIEGARRHHVVHLPLGGGVAAGQAAQAEERIAGGEILDREVIRRG